MFVEHKKSPSQERRAFGYFIQWQERVVFSVQKETQDLLHTPRKKRERRERTLKNWGRNPRKEKEKILRGADWRH